MEGGECAGRQGKQQGHHGSECPVARVQQPASIQPHAIMCKIVIVVRFTDNHPRLLTERVCIADFGAIHERLAHAAAVFAAADVSR